MPSLVPILLLTFSVLATRPLPPSHPSSVKTSQLIEFLPSLHRPLQQEPQSQELEENFYRVLANEMRDEGVITAVFVVESTWSDRGRSMSDWRIVSEKYFADRDQRKIITGAQLHQIETGGLRSRLESVVLAQTKSAKSAFWFQFPQQSRGTGYCTFLFRADEWPPVAPSLYSAYDPGTTPLMHASLLGDAERAKKLLSDGANVNAVSPDGSTALIYAAASDDPGVLELLISHGAKVNARTKHDGNALTTAVVTDHPQNVEILLKAGANPNVKSGDDERPLKIAVENRYNEITQILKKAGAHE